LLYAAGLALLTTMAGEVTAGLGSRSALAPLLVAPLAVPLLIAASQAQESLARGKGMLTWTLLMVAADLVLLIVGILVARPLEEAGR
jgi:ABC-type transport system involved in cytochrome c biogenesis permease component